MAKKKRRLCPRCNGKGKVDIIAQIGPDVFYSPMTVPCSYCHGTGRVE